MYLLNNRLDEKQAEMHRTRKSFSIGHVTLHQRWINVDSMLFQHFVSAEKENYDNIAKLILLIYLLFFVLFFFQLSIYFFIYYLFFFSPAIFDHNSHFVSPYMFILTAMYWKRRKNIIYNSFIYLWHVTIYTVLISAPCPKTYYIINIK